MKLASQKFCLVVASAALVFAGCSKKPTRPDPAATVLGPQGGPGSSSIMPADVNVNPMAPGLEQRSAEWNELGQNRTALKDQAVYFDFDQSAIKPAERAKLKIAKEYLDKNPGFRVMLEGHCDWHGTAEYNLGLGDRRANSVKKYLQSLGVGPDRMETVSKGSLEATKEGGDAVWAKDRRVDLVVVNPAATTPAVARLPGAL